MKDPVSRRTSSLSLTVSLPFLRWLSRASLPPPSMSLEALARKSLILLIMDIADPFSSSFSAGGRYPDRPVNNKTYGG